MSHRYGHMKNDRINYGQQITIITKIFYKQFSFQYFFLSTMIRSRKLIGEKFGFKHNGLKPNKKYRLNVNVTDSVGHTFKNTKTFQADQSGNLDLGMSSGSVVEPHPQGPTTTAAVGVLCVGLRILRLQLNRRDLNRGCGSPAEPLDIPT